MRVCVRRLYWLITMYNNTYIVHSKYRLVPIVRSGSFLQLNFSLYSWTSRLRLRMVIKLNGVLVSRIALWTRFNCLAADLYRDSAGLLCVVRLYCFPINISLIFFIVFFGSVWFVSLWRYELCLVSCGLCSVCVCVILV